MSVVPSPEPGNVLPGVNMTEMRKDARMSPTVRAMLRILEPIESFVTKLVNEKKALEAELSDTRAQLQQMQLHWAGEKRAAARPPDAPPLIVMEVRDHAPMAEIRGLPTQG